MKLIIISLILSLFQPVMSANLARELRMASEIVDAILDGDPEMLEVDGYEFLSIYTEAEEQAKGAVIIMHGRGFHPDWADAIQPLRVGLAESGWNTLSLQMPVLDKTAKYYDYEPVFPEAIPRIESAVRFLKEAGAKKIIIIAHSCGAHMAMEYVRQKGDDAFDAYVGIGMGATDYKQPMKQPFPLEKIAKPILDIYGSDDYPAVHRLAPKRLSQMKDAGNEKSKQVKIEDANHYFTDQGEPLLEVVSEWLDTL
ncbi:MAG: DUF3530 family protein [Gammaproteobacteria bacterium]|nr:DUF3530 family protein [Gammaproteobacteria bacterium]